MVPVWGTLESPQEAAVKGGRRPAKRTLEGCVGWHPRRCTMELAGRPTAGLCEPQQPSEIDLTRCVGLDEQRSPKEGPKAPTARQGGGAAAARGTGGLNQ